MTNEDTVKRIIFFNSIGELQLDFANFQKFSFTY